MVLTIGSARLRGRLAGSPAGLYGAFYPWGPRRAVREGSAPGTAPQPGRGAETDAHRNVLPRPHNPLIVQGDHTVLVEVDSPRYAEARDELVAFAELVKSPEHIHTYRITPLSIWNARSAGLAPDRILATLAEYSKYPVPEHVTWQIRDFASRYGRLRLEREGGGLALVCDDDVLAEEVSRHKSIAALLRERTGARTFRISAVDRGRLKQALVQVGYPAEDLAGYTEGAKLPVSLRQRTRAGEPFELRAYQGWAVRAFHAEGSARGGSGVIVLPCGAGKTIVGVACMAELGMSTLILTTGITASRQWAGELLDKTSLDPADVGLYDGSSKEIRPVTIATYHIVTHRRRKTDEFSHLALFDEHNWGLIIYDEVHLLPAPVFQVTASLQAKRRLGLTATLVREDGREDDVFALIGPKKMDVPWKVVVGDAARICVRAIVSAGRRRDRRNRRSLRFPCYAGWPLPARTHRQLRVS